MNPLPPSDDPNLRAVELEYASLREEILRRVDSRQQTLSVAVTLSGAFLGLGWGTGAAVALLLLPVILACLAAGWAQNEAKTYLLHAYIRERVAPRLPSMGWEAFQRDRRAVGFLGLPVEVLSIGGIFLITQVMALVLGLFRFDPRSLVEWVLLAAAAVSVLALLALLNFVVGQSKT